MGSRPSGNLLKKTPNVGEGGEAGVDCQNAPPHEDLVLQICGGLVKGMSVNRPFSKL